MSAYRFTLPADVDLTSIVAYVAHAHDVNRAVFVCQSLMDAIERLAHRPRMGEARTDLTARPVLTWRLYSYLIVYRADSTPLEIVRILQDARAPLNRRDKAGDRFAARSNESDTNSAV